MPCSLAAASIASIEKVASGFTDGEVRIAGFRRR
jgi:hypothetical protein